jgi:hypothetical protein
MYPEPKPKTRVINIEIRETQNGCKVCGGTGKVPGGYGCPIPQFLPCPYCGWE